MTSAGNDHSIAIGKNTVADVDNSVFIGSCENDLIQEKAKKINIIGCGNSSEITISANKVNIYGYDAVRKINKFQVHILKMMINNEDNTSVLHYGYRIKIKKYQADNVTGKETEVDNISFHYNSVGTKTINVIKSTQSNYVKYGTDIGILLFDPIFCQFEYCSLDKVWYSTNNTTIGLFSDIDLYVVVIRIVYSGEWSCATHLKLPPLLPPKPCLSFLPPPAAVLLPLLLFWLSMIKEVANMSKGG